MKQLLLSAMSQVVPLSRNRLWLPVEYLLRSAAYYLLRSFYAFASLAVVLSSFFFGPWFGCFVVLMLGYLVTRIEDVPSLERFCQRLEADFRRRRTRWLSHPEDIHLIVYNVVFLVGYGLAFWMYLNPDVSGLVSLDRHIGFFLGAGTALGWAAGVNLGVCYHNHLHLGIFKNQFLNRWIGRLWTIPCGWPAYFWTHKHVTVHHKHVGEDCDWVQPKRKSDGSYESIHAYIFLHWPCRYARHFWSDYWAGRSVKRTRLASEFLFFVLFWQVPFWLDFKLACGLWLYPHWVGSAFILGCGMYTQHVGGTDEFPYSHSTTFLSKFFNLTMFNVGYHTEHHIRPAVHWAELPSMHEQMREQLIDGRAHVVGYGSYKATRLLRSTSNPVAALSEFLKQHPDYCWEQAKSNDS